VETFAVRLFRFDYAAGAIILIGLICVSFAAVVIWRRRGNVAGRRSMQQGQDGVERIFGFREEWRDFEKRNALFLERFPRLQQAAELTFNQLQLSEPIDKFVFMYGRVCLEDFYEILLCCANGNGQAAQKLLRGLYERAVTLEYLHEHPEELDDFYDFHRLSQRKLKIACENTMGKDVFTDEMASEIEEDFREIKDKFMVTDCVTCGTKKLNHSWNKLDFVAMANKTSIGKLIVLGYYIPLRQAHATVASMISRMVATEDGGISFEQTAQRGPADNALRVSHNILLNVIRVENEHFKIPGLKDRYDICLQDFMDIWRGRSASSSRAN
jgi:hypothetical protein